MNILVFAGAGTSVELGIPAMAGMAQEFLAHCEQWNFEHTVVKQLLDGTLDIEHLIEEVDKICSAAKSLASLGQANESMAKFDSIRAEIEWFVQHAAERVAPPDAHLMWGPLLRLTSNHSVSFVTTNYDRAIELAANAEGVSLTDGFEKFGAKEVASWHGIMPEDGNTPLIKLHGSTDWFADSRSGAPQKLRHPMPLFGRGRLRIGDGNDDIELGSALILPSREKLLSRAPYPRMTQAFLNAADNCDIAVFVGTSLRDRHIRDAARQTAKHKPVFIVNPEGNNEGVENSVPVAQTASMFLISTLPSALRYASPVEVLNQAAKAASKSPIGILSLLRSALNPREPTSQRCDAIEQLDQYSVALDSYLVKSLINDADATVSRYALGLLATSPDRSELFTFAKEARHTSDPSYSEELNLLQQLMLREASNP